MITGLGIGGDPIPLNPDMVEREAAWAALLGVHPSTLQAGMVRYSWFEEQYRGSKPEKVEVEYCGPISAKWLGSTLASSVLRLGRSRSHHSVWIHELDFSHEWELDRRLLAGLGGT
ncbi:hypothetical protein ACSBR1_032841 [Camellia fascicularis]